jgi:hypothetical protein
VENSYIALFFLPMCKKKTGGTCSASESLFEVRQVKLSAHNKQHRLYHSNHGLGTLDQKAEIKKAGKKQKQAGYLRSLLEDTVIKKY